MPQHCACLKVRTVRFKATFEVSHEFVVIARVLLTISGPKRAVEVEKALVTSVADVRRCGEGESSHDWEKDEQTHRGVPEPSHGHGQVVPQT